MHTTNTVCSSLESEKVEIGLLLLTFGCDSSPSTRNVKARETFWSGVAPELVFFCRAFCSFICMPGGGGENDITEGGDETKV